MPTLSRTIKKTRFAMLIDHAFPSDIVNGKQLIRQRPALVFAG